MISDIYALLLTVTKPNMEMFVVDNASNEELVTGDCTGSWTTMASWYGVGDGYHGQMTASGEIFNAYDYTAAHNSLRFGTRVRVTNLHTNRSVVVRINDRGAFNSLGRGIDLSYGAARAIGGVDAGVFPVRLEVLR